MTTLAVPGQNRTLKLLSTNRTADIPDARRGISVPIAVIRTINAKPHSRDVFIADPLRTLNVPTEARTLAVEA